MLSDRLYARDADAQSVEALVHESQGCLRRLPIWGFSDPYRSMPSTKSRVHPKYKAKCRVGNWSDYDRSLVERGNLTVWLSPDAIAHRRSSVIGSGLVFGSHSQVDGGVVAY